MKIRRTETTVNEAGSVSPEAKQNYHHNTESQITLRFGDECLWGDLCFQGKKQSTGRHLRSGNEKLLSSPNEETENRLFTLRAGERTRCEDFLKIEEITRFS